jgi:hypothetical protein
MSFANGAEYATLIETEYDRGSVTGSQSVTGGQSPWQGSTSKSWHTKSNNPPSMSSEFDLNKHGKFSVASSRSVAGSARSFSSGYVEPDTTIHKKGGWAKIPAYVRVLA